MSKSGIKKENFNPVADFMLSSFERDLADFTKVFKTMDANYLAEFKKANEAVRNINTTYHLKEEQKAKTKEIYAIADGFKDKLSLLKVYAQRASVEPLLIKETLAALRNRNIENAVKNIREMLPFYTSKASLITDMPSGFLDKFSAVIDRLENASTEQNLLMSRKNQSISEGKPVYDTLYKYISEVATAGKLVYKDQIKKGDYTISKILSRLNSPNVRKEK